MRSWPCQPQCLPIHDTFILASVDLCQLNFGQCKPLIVRENMPVRFMLAVLFLPKCYGYHVRSQVLKSFIYFRFYQSGP